MTGKHSKHPVGPPRQGPGSREVWPPGAHGSGPQQETLPPGTAPKPAGRLTPAEHRPRAWSCVLLREKGRPVREPRPKGQVTCLCSPDSEPRSTATSSACGCSTFPGTDPRPGVEGHLEGRGCALMRGVCGAGDGPSPQASLQFSPVLPRPLHRHFTVRTRPVHFSSAAVKQLSMLIEQMPRSRHSSGCSGADMGGSVSGIPAHPSAQGGVRSGLA